MNKRAKNKQSKLKRLIAAEVSRQLNPTGGMESLSWDYGAEDLTVVHHFGPTREELETSRELARQRNKVDRIAAQDEIARQLNEVNRRAGEEYRTMAESMERIKMENHSYQEWKDEHQESHNQPAASPP